jgi:transcriptional regulator with XRE-family HTH domain
METRAKLAEILRAKRWTQSDLAREIGERPHWVNDRVSGRIQIKADELPRLARALGVPCHRFFEDADCPEARERELSSTIRPLRNHRPLVEILEEQILEDLAVAGFTSFEREALTEVADTLLRYRRRIQGEEASGE